LRRLGARSQTRCAQRRIYRCFAEAFTRRGTNHYIIQKLYPDLTLLRTR
jgi:hypothetical protein